MNNILRHPLTLIFSFVLLTACSGPPDDAVAAVAPTEARSTSSTTSMATPSESIGAVDSLALPAASLDPLSLPDALADALDFSDEDNIVIAVTRDEDDACTTEVAVSIPNEVIGFAFNSAEIDNAGQEHLRSFAEVLGSATSVEIVGHASADGDSVHNLLLSEERAESVALVLEPLLPDNINVRHEGVGESMPQAGLDHADPSNRRVVIVWNDAAVSCASLSAPE